MVSYLIRSPVMGDMTHCSDGAVGTAPAFAEGRVLSELGNH